MDEVDKILKDYVTTDKKIVFYFINCDFVIEFDDKITTNIETKCIYNTDITKIKRCLLYDFYQFTSRGYKVCNINQMSIKTISDRCNMTYEHYLNQPMHFVSLRLNMVFAKNLQLMNSLDRNINYPLIRKYSHVPINQ